RTGRKLEVGEPAPDCRTRQPHFASKISEHRSQTMSEIENPIEGFDETDCRGGIAAAQVAHDVLDVAENEVALLSGKFHHPRQATRRRSWRRTGGICLGARRQASHAVEAGPGQTPLLPSTARTPAALPRSRPRSLW